MPDTLNVTLSVTCLELHSDTLSVTCIELHSDTLSVTCFELHSTWAHALEHAMRGQTHSTSHRVAMHSTLSRATKANVIEGLL